MKTFQWTKSSFCDAGSCVEVFVDDDEDLVFVRNSNSGAVLAAQFFTAEEWRAFTAGVKAGEFDV